MYSFDKKDSECTDNASISNFTPLCSINSNSNLSWIKIPLKITAWFRQTRIIEKYHKMSQNFTSILGLLFAGSIYLIWLHFSSYLTGRSGTSVEGYRYKSQSETPQVTSLTFCCQRKETLLWKTVFLRI
jgi:hypothetical protein